MAKSTKRLTRYYYLKRAYYGPDTPWEDVPDELKEREAYLDSDEYVESVQKREPWRDVREEDRRRVEAQEAEKVEAAKLALAQKTKDEEAKAAEEKAPEPKAKKKAPPAKKKAKAKEK